MNIAQAVSMLDQHRDCPLQTTALALNCIPSRSRPKVYFIVFETLARRIHLPCVYRVKAYRCCIICRHNRRPVELQYC